MAPPPARHCSIGRIVEKTDAWATLPFVAELKNNLAD
jgi:hypothetical protein